MVAAQRLIGILVLLLLVPLASAYGIERAWLDWQGHEVRTISPSKSLPGTVLRLELSADYATCFDPANAGHVCALLLDAPALGISRLRLDVKNSCARTNGTIACKTAPFTFSTANESIPIAYTTQVGAEIVNAQATVTVALDATSPRLSTITTGYCRSETCYVGGGVPSPVTISFTDTVTAFDYRLVFVGKSGAGAVTTMDRCSGSECSGTIIVPCSEGEQFALELKSAGGISSREDAQNDALPAERPQRFVCLTRGPQITEFTYAADGIAGQAVSGGSATFTARVKSTIGEIAGSVNATGITGDGNATAVSATCGPASDTTDSTMQTCTWHIDGLNPGTFELEFIVEDPLGLYATKRQKVTVLHLRSPPANQSLDYFSSKVTKVTPEQLNRLALDVAAHNNMPWPMHISYALARKKGAARILQQEVRTCWYKLPSDRNYTIEYNLFALGASAGNRPETHVLRPDADWNESNRIDAQVRAAREVLMRSDTFEVKCELRLTVLEGNTLYSEPELENLTFKVGLRETPLGEPGAALVKEIKRTESKVTSSTAEKIRKLEKWRQKADQVCKGAETYVEIYNAGVVLQGTGTGLCATGYLYTIGKTINGVGDGIFGRLDGFFERAWNGGSGAGGPQGIAADSVLMTTQLLASNNALMDQGGWLRKICRQVNCRVTADLQSAPSTRGGTPEKPPSATDVGHGADLAQSQGNKYDNPANWGTINDDEFTLQNYAKEEVLALANVADPEKSLTGALATACLGGVVYNLQKYQSIECGYLQCLKEQSYYGHSIAVCKNAKRYRMCQQVVGEAMELPWIRVWENVMSNINGIIKNLPQFFAKFSLNKACNNYYGEHAQATQTGTNCPDYAMVACRVGSTALNYLSTGKDTAQALGGLRNEDAAKAALEICENAIKKNATQTRPYTESLGNSAAFDSNNYLRMAQGSSVQTPENEFIGDMNAYIQQAYGGVPQSYRIEGDKFVATYTANGQTRTQSFPLRTQGQVGEGLGRTSTVQYVAIEYDAQKGSAIPILSKFARIANPTYQAGPVTAEADLTGAVDQATGTGRTVKREARVYLPAGESVTGQSVETLMAESRYVYLVSQGVYPTSVDHANTLYIYYTLAQAQQNGWSNYAQLKQQVAAYERQKNDYIEQLEEARQNGEAQALSDAALADWMEEEARKMEQLADQTAQKMQESVPKSSNEQQQRETSQVRSSGVDLNSAEYTAALNALSVVAQRNGRVKVERGEVYVEVNDGGTTRWHRAENLDILVRSKVLQADGVYADLARKAQIGSLARTQAAATSQFQQQVAAAQAETTRLNNLAQALRTASETDAAAVQDLLAAWKDDKIIPESINTYEEAQAYLKEEAARNERALQDAQRNLERLEAEAAIGTFENEVLIFKDQYESMLARYRNECQGSASQACSELKARIDYYEQEVPGLKTYADMKQNREKYAQEAKQKLDAYAAQLCTACAAQDITDIRIDAVSKKMIIQTSSGPQEVALTDEQLAQAKLLYDDIALYNSGSDEELLFRASVEDGKRVERNLENYRQARAHAEAMAVIADYAFKWAMDQYGESLMKYLEWYKEVPVINDLVEFTDVNKKTQSLCEELEYDIRDNDDGAIYRPSQLGIPQILATFASEVREYDNGTAKGFAYITVAHVVNPQRDGFQMEIIFTDVEKCAARSCKPDHSLTNGARFNLTQDNPFASGQYAKTRIEYLPAKYKRICLRFDKEFPDASGKRTYCRSITEDAFDAGSPLPPATVSASSTAGSGTNPAGGWS